MNRKKVIYFDYWTVGIKNFTRFDLHLKSQGYETKLIHLSSWRKIDGPAHEIIHDIECFDIKYYNTIYLHEVLKREEPMAVIMLNASFVTDRTIILSCKKLGIRSIYLMHGALTREEFIEETIKSINESMKWLKFKRVLNHLRGTVLNYLNSSYQLSLKNILSLHPYTVLLNTLINPGTYLHFPPPAFDLKPDLALVYGLADFAFYTKRLNFPENSVKVVGNPDLDQYFQQIDKLGNNKYLFLKTHNIPIDRPYITYIEEGLAEDKIWENEQRISFVTEINEACRQTGFHLVIKLHPRTARGPHFGSIQQLENVTVLAHADFPELIYHTEKCVSHYSTTLIYAMLMDKPILVPRWGRSKALFNLYSPKEVTFVPTLQDFQSLLQQRSFRYDRDEYINNAVPFKDGKTSDRIANHILEAIQ